MPTTEQAKVCQRDCASKRQVVLLPTLVPGYVKGKCSSCHKNHQYKADAIPAIPKIVPIGTPPSPNGEMPIPTHEPDLDLSLDRDCVRLSWGGKTYTIGKIKGHEFQKFENGKGLHRETNSFGMPFALLKFLEAKGVKYIKIFYGGYWHNTTVENFHKQGFFLYFKGRAEKRIYLKREFFK